MTAAGLAATGLPAPPPYGVRTLAEVVPSLLSAVGAAGFANPLAIAPARSACLLLVDGLGWELLREHADAAPFLTELAAGTSPISAGFPATTAVSLTSLGTGRPAGEHGIVGYTFAVPDLGVLNALTWRTHGAADPVDLREAFPPEEAQPWPTLLERAAAGGPSVSVAAPAYQAGSGLTRTAFRGGRFQPVYALGDLAAALTGAGTTALWYGYHGDLDTLGHRYGPGSRQWRMQLAQVDALVRTIATNLPAGGLLAVTADHGMVPVPESEQVDADSEPALRPGVRLLGGEVRARHVYARPGAEAEVLAAWRSTLGGRAWVLGRDEAIAAGWFGPTVTDAARERIGDVVAALRGTSGVVRRTAEPVESSLRGHHGSLTSAEQLVPLLLARG